MATTPTYSWPIPDDTDLVKDGAEAIRDLGNAIDTTVDGLPGAGLVHINTTSFSAVAAASLPNDTFSSTFKNYRLLINLTDGGGNGTLRLRLRASGTDNTSAIYYQGGWSVTTGGTGSAASLANATSWALIDLGAFAATRFSASVDLHTPKVNGETTLNSLGQGNSPSRFLAGYHDTSASFDAVTIFESTGANISGSIQVFGYKD
jgi:hypothetical protein